MAAKPASLDMLNLLHDLQTQSMIKRLQQDLDDGIPTDAATLGAISKFLKDNEVTADPAEDDQLSELREKMRKQSEERRARAGQVISLVQEDMCKEA